MTRRVRRMALVGVVAALALASPGAAYADGAALDQATPKQLDDAKTQYKKAKKAFDKKNFEEALAGFRDSYGTVASPNSHLMVARTLVELGRTVEAYQEFDATAAEADAAAKADEKYAQTAQSARNEMNEVRKKLGMLKVIVADPSPGAKVSVGDAELPSSSWGKEVPKEPGKYVVTLTTPSGSKVQREVQLDAGGGASIDLAEASEATQAGEAPPTEESAAVELDSKKGGGRTLAYVAGGIGVLGLATFGIFGAMNNSAFGKLEDRCTNGQCPPDLQDDRDSGETYQTVANVGLVVGVVGLAAGTVLFLTSKPSQEATTAARGPRVGVGVGPGSVTVAGSF